MKFVTKTASVILLSTILTACSGGGGTPGVDVSKVLGRVSSALTAFQNKLKAEGVTKPTDVHLKQLAQRMANAMNNKPAIHTTPVGVHLLKEFSFEGFADANKNNVRDSGEAKLFKVEVDYENNRLIGSGVSERGGFTGMGLAGGMLAGMLMGRLMGGQRGAGVKSNSFNKRSVQSRSSYSQKRSSAAAKRSSAKSRANSGGRFRGK